MALFVIADLHLSFASDKPMDIFGGWDDYVTRIKDNWEREVMPEDTVVIPGDISWAMDFSHAAADFDFINKLPGRKIIMKGNHDYWWNTLSKMNGFLSDNGFDSISILHNNHYAYGEYGICGTRGWINENTEPADKKVLAREANRLETSIKSALKEKLTPIVFLHYPPIYGSQYNYEMLDVIYRYDLKYCYYGHLHGNACKNALNGERDGVYFQLISGDFIQFCPYRIL